MSLQYKIHSVLWCTNRSSIRQFHLFTFIVTALSISHKTKSVFTILLYWYSPRRTLTKSSLKETMTFNGLLLLIVASNRFYIEWFKNSNLSRFVVSLISRTLTIFRLVTFVVWFFLPRVTRDLRFYATREYTYPSSSENRALVL